MIGTSLSSHSAIEIQYIMNLSTKLFLKESIEIELNTGDLYQLFSVKFPIDYDFWWKIAMEEINHAALIESINDIFLTEEILPLDTIEKRTEDLQKMNQSIKERIEYFKLFPPTRPESFKFGIEIENSIGEVHFELFMRQKPNSQMSEIFQRLNGDDINHAQRIENYLKKISV